MEVCRDSQIVLQAAYFKLFSCAMCYKFLFHNAPALKPVGGIKLGPVSGSDVSDPDSVVYADVNNSTAVKFVCKTLGKNDCIRWTTCCNAASSCCDQQLTIPIRNTSTGQLCPRTWDGYGCFGDTKAGTRIHISCPSYLDNTAPSATAYKDCTENGTWWINPESNKEWTNYTTCVRKQDFHTVVYVSLACNLFSIALLIPACAIFLYIRQLRVQKRIKLHICLLSSFLATAGVTVLWDFIVYLDRLENVAENTVMAKNSGGCKLLYVLSRYVRTANFFWMSCEGFYLHRLIVHAFETPKRLVPYYIFGWGCSWLPVIVYSVIRVAKPSMDESCWVAHAGGFEWIMYTPNLLCILINVIFLLNILRILLTKLQAHPNEPSNYRKALKATFVLVPLFGLQQFIVIYRPEERSAAFVYEIIHSVISNTQGAAVALIFCFLNGEVHTYLKPLIRRHWRRAERSEYSRKGSTISTTQFTAVPTSPSTMTPTTMTPDKPLIPLSESNNDQDFVQFCDTDLQNSSSLL